MSALTIDDSLLHYEVLGRGRPVILLHTWLGSWRYWVPCMQQLSVKYRVYALDLWGFGDSGRNVRRYDFASQVTLLHEFMDKLGIGKAALVGHGLGAGIGARYALQHPGRVPRLMAVAPPLFRMAPTLPAGAPPPDDDRALQPVALPPDPPDTPATTHEQFQSIMEERARRLGEQRLEAPKAPVPRRVVGPVPAMPQAAGADGRPSQANPLKQHLAILDRNALLRRHVSPAPERDRLLLEVAKADRTALSMSIESFAQVDTLRDLLALEMPAVAVHGLADTFLPPLDATLLQTASDGRTPIPAIGLNDARHFPMVEQPTVFARLLIDFLEAPDVASLAIKETWERRVR